MFYKLLSLKGLSISQVTKSLLLVSLVVKGLVRLKRASTNTASCEYLYNRKDSVSKDFTIHVLDKII